MHIKRTGSLMTSVLTSEAGGARRLLSILCAVVALFAVHPAPAAAATLQGIDYSVLPGETVQLRLHLSGPVPKPGSFTVDNPARIALDLPGTDLGATKKSLQIGVGMTDSVRAVQAGGRTRVVVKLFKMVPYGLRVDANDIYLTVQGGAAAASAGASVLSGQTGTTSAKTANSLTNVDFRRGPNGEGRVIVKMSNPSATVDVQESKGQIVVNLPGTAVPKKLERRLNVVDFATPVQTVDTMSRNGGARLVITPHGNFEQLAYQTDDTLTIEVKPATRQQKEAAKKNEFGYSGEKLSLNFQNIEVRAVLQLLADFTGMNLVASDTVQGSLTLRLKNVPWDQALDIVLKSKGLAARKMGNVIMVAPANEIAAQEKQELESKQQVEDLAPLQSESIQINYAKASDIAALLKSKDNTLLSARGSVTIDDRTNKLLIKDTAANLEAVHKLVKELDVAVRQVLIESRIVLATDNFSKELGVRFGVSGYRQVGPTKNLLTSGSLTATDEIHNGTDLTAPDRFNVNLPVTNLAGQGGTIGLALDKIAPGTLIELELSAAQAEGKTEIISAPRVITANQKEAVIKQGVEIPYQEASSSGATSVSFKDAVLSLTVTPQITPDDRVNMDLKVTKDTKGDTVNGVPAINTQEVDTQVLVDDGQTVVLGGIYEQTKAHQVHRVPFFGDLPVVGALFRDNYNQNDKSELLVFIKPKILQEGAKLP